MVPPGFFRRLRPPVEQTPTIEYPYPPQEALRFNPKYNSGWLYVAQTLPDANGLVGWAAAIRSRSTTPIDTSAQLVYGVTNVRTKEHFSGYLPSGTLTETADRMETTFVANGKTLLRCAQTDDTLSQFDVFLKLPLPQGEFRFSRLASLSSPVLYESGDGVVPLRNGIDSLYVSLPIAGLDGLWIDAQKFNLGAGSMASRGVGLEANHRWMSFILQRNCGTLPTGTVGVCWELLDTNNHRKPGGYTNFDLLVPGSSQKTAADFQIEEVDYWNSGEKSYLKRWLISQPEFGVRLLCQTIVDNQESVVGPSHFYEGATLVFDPDDPHRIVGSGMLEQTHDEAGDHRIFMPFITK